MPFNQLSMAPGSERCGYESFDLVLAAVGIGTLADSQEQGVHTRCVHGASNDLSPIPGPTANISEKPRGDGIPRIPPHGSNIDFGSDAKSVPL